MSERDDVLKLTYELFRLVEGAQGYAFIYDGEVFDTKAQFFETLRGRLRYSIEVTALIKQFLRKYKQGGA